jgi:hypothetical protein
MTEVALPIFRQFDRYFKQSDFAGCGVVVAYGSKNSADNGTLSLQPEVLGIFSPAAACHAFVAGIITNQALADASKIYLMDRDTVGTMKPVNLRFE